MYFLDREVAVQCYPNPDSISGLTRVTGQREGTKEYRGRRRASLRNKRKAPFQSAEQPVPGLVSRFPIYHRCDNRRRLALSRQNLASTVQATLVGRLAYPGVSERRNETRQSVARNKFNLKVDLPTLHSREAEPSIRLN